MNFMFNLQLIARTQTFHISFYAMTHDELTVIHFYARLWMLESNQGGNIFSMIFRMPHYVQNIIIFVLKTSVFGIKGKLPNFGHFECKFGKVSKLIKITDKIFE